MTAKIAFQRPLTNALAKNGAGGSPSRAPALAQTNFGACSRQGARGARAMRPAARTAPRARFRHGARPPQGSRVLATALAVGTGTTEGGGRLGAWGCASANVTQRRPATRHSSTLAARR